MAWSQDQSLSHALTQPAAPSEHPAEHPAKAIMTRRWEERRAQASARWTDITSSVVLERADIAGTPPAAQATLPLDIATESPSEQSVLADLHVLELKTAEDQSLQQSLFALRMSAAPIGHAWLRDTQRAMVIVALVSHTVLLALLYFGGFLK
jgi:hypothetical protein